MLIFLTCLAAQGVAVMMANRVLAIDEGDDQMRNVAGCIREGSEAYMLEMFGTIGRMLIPATLVIFFLYMFKDGFMKAVVVTLSFALGAFCSSLAGIIGMWSSTRANSRVARTACVGTFRQTIVVALRSGAIAGIIVVSMAVLGISFLFSLCRLLVEDQISRVPELLVGYGCGASLVAMFAQLGGRNLHQSCRC